MASSLNTPDVLTQPIATNGDKNSIPSTNDESLGLMSQSKGFPAICSERIADGGKAPRRADFNGAFFLLSQLHFFLQNGGTPTFRQDVSDAIGGYPEGAILWYKPAVGDVMIVRSEIQNNTYNFNTDPSYIDGLKWKVVTPTLGGNNTWTGDTTFTGNVSFTDADAKAGITALGIPDYSRSVSASTTLNLVQAVTEDSELRVFFSNIASEGSFTMCYISLCDEDGVVTKGGIICCRSGYEGAPSTASVVLPAGSYFKVEAWSLSVNTTLQLTPLKGV